MCNQISETIVKLMYLNFEELIMIKDTPKEFCLIKHGPSQQTLREDVPLFQIPAL